MKKNWMFMSTIIKPTIITTKKSKLIGAKDRLESKLNIESRSRKRLRNKKCLKNRNDFAFSISFVFSKINKI